MNNKKSSLRSSYNSEAQALSRLQALEQRVDLYKHKVDGYSAWRLLRRKLALILQNMPLSTSSTTFGLSWVEERLLYFFRELSVFLFSGHKDMVIKTVSTALSEEENGFYKDVYFDELLGSRDTFFKIETLNNPHYAARRKKALYPVAMTTSSVDLIAAVFAFFKFPPHLHTVSKHIYNDIRHEFQDYSLGIKDIQLTLLRFYWSKRVYKILLSRIQPKITISADPGQFAFWAASQELGIPTVEFQHGIFTRDHPNALNATMTDYRNSLIAPNKIFLFGEYWQQQLLLNKYYQDELVSVGSPRIDRYRAMRENALKADGHNEKVSILLTSQGLDVEKLIDFINTFVELAKKKLKYSLCIKLHPAEKEKSPYLQGLSDQSHIQVLYGLESPSTFNLMAHSDLHISIASTAHYDALGLFVPTAVLPLTGSEIVQSLVDAGHAHAMHSPQDLVDLALSIRDHTVPQEVSYYYYKPNAVQNIKRELSLLMK
jgi:hypothetical protein